MKILKINPKNRKSALKQTILIIQKGGVVVCPTDTVYGLIVDVKNSSAVKKVFKIKNRRFNKPLPVFIKNIKAAKKLAHINKNQEKFLKKFWPGQLTVVLKAKNKKIPKGVISKDDKIGLRVPDHGFLNDLLKKFNHPLVATSANIAGKKASGKIVEVLKQFKYKKDEPDLALDAGNLKQAPPSTVIDLENFKIIRKGEISKKQVLNELKTQK